MPVRHAIWKVGDPPVPLDSSRLECEQILENMIVRNPCILSDEWMLIGQQESTPSGGRVDLVAVAPDGGLVLIELKRDRTPREVVAQAIEYAAWLEELTADRIASIYQRFSKGGNLSQAFAAHFGTELEGESLNQSHQIVIVASELDESTETIVAYLNDKNIPINVLSFQVFRNGSDQLLSRAWMIDPVEAQVSTGTRSQGEREPWNGEFYVSFGDGEARSWEEARRYGFISGGGGPWYSRTLKVLSPGDRVWVNVPQGGFVGVGRVSGVRQRVSESKLATSEGEKSSLDVLKEGHYHRNYANDPDRAEYLVPVQWNEAVPLASAFREVGRFGNQNTVCKPTTPQWRRTVERLKQHFPKWEG